MQKELAKQKKNGSTITLTWSPYDSRATRYIWSDLAGREVGTNPVHVGVCYNGIVYCNIHPSGIPKRQWISDFNYPRVKHVTETPF